MSDSYTKLFASITESTIWGEAAGTRLLWITFLAKPNRNGEVYGSIPGMARLANITLRECEIGLGALMAPDPYSRTETNEGRRIEPVDGGWRILNHAKFDKIRSQIEAQEREAERKRQWDREHRGNRPNSAHRTPDEPPTNPDAPPTVSDPPLAVTVSKARAKATGQQADLGEGFNAFWDAYPLKKAKAAARKAWAKAKPPSDLLARLDAQKTFDDEWLRGFIPRASTYLNGECWNDEIAKPKSNGSHHETRPQRLQRELESIHRARIADGTERHDDARIVDMDVGVLRGEVVKYLG